MSPKHAKRQPSHPDSPIFATMTQTNRNSWVILLFPGLAAVFISVITRYPQWIEIRYSQGLFPFLSKIQRSVSGIFPFSIGDLAYMFIICLISWRTFKFLKAYKSQEKKKAFLINALRSIISFCLWAYCIFYLLWGLNYYRQGVIPVFGLKKHAVNKEEITSLTWELRDSLHASARFKKQTDSIPHLVTSYEGRAASAYGNLQKKFPTIYYKKKSFKASLFGEFGNYMGIQGYYNPFTGESQINTHTPSFLIPFVACHEIAHQLGFASESEANFVGFLAAKHAEDPHVRYSAYLNMFMYAANQLKRTDSLALKKIIKELDPDVKADIRTYYTYLEKYQSPLQDGSSLFYDFYLKQNSQKKGIETYGEVTKWLVAYRKTYGKL
jgi:hypothetical protein